MEQHLLQLQLLMGYVVNESKVKKTLIEIYSEFTAYFSQTDSIIITSRQGPFRLINKFVYLL